MTTNKLTCTVLIPTWKRPEKLSWCLESLVKQIRPANQIVIAHRQDDLESIDVINMYKHKLPLTCVYATESGVIHAENQAMQVAEGHIWCFLDDDAEAPPHWIHGLMHHFEQDINLAGVGGPDFITGMPPDYRRIVPKIGHLCWYGRVIGNHHQLLEKVSRVRMLKGVNMAFRRQWLRLLDEKLSSEHSKGNGSFWEMDLCLEISGKGGKLLFDPALDVRHHSNHTHFVKLENLKNSSHNMVYVLLKHLSFFRSLVFVTYALVIGNRQLRGILWTLINLFVQGPSVLSEAFYSWWGMLQGIKTFLHSKKEARQKASLGIT